MLIRPATLIDATAIAEVHVTSWRETYRNIVPQSHLDKLDVNKRELLWKQDIKNGRFISVAEEKGKVIGFADGGKFRGLPTNIKGELIYSLPITARVSAQHYLIVYDNF